jgi:uncharacterized protein YecE (DUF72 family)
LSAAAPVVERFLNGGVLELQDKLGPINWQLLPTTRFDPVDFEGFLQLLPRSTGGRALRHGVEARHTSFRVPEFVDMMRHYGVAIIIAGDSEYPQIADLTAPFVYARIMGTQPGEPSGYSPGALDQWARRARCWAAGDVPEELETATPISKPKKSERVDRDVFLYVINGHKVANPSAAMALIERLASS